MGFKHATLRQRLFHAVKHETEDTKHRHLHEYLHEGLFVFTNVMFLAGSFCFFEGVGYSMWVFMLGDWLFIIAAFMQLVLVGQSLHEQILAKKHLTSKFSERDRHEVLETCLFFVACFVFWLGSIFFMPGIYQSKEAERIGHEVGAWNFVVGSMGLVVASYYNALGLAAERAKHPEDHAKEYIVYQLHCSALCLAQLGGVAFACGSFLYRPAFNTECKGTSENGEEVFDTAINNGTILYVIGSALFVLQSLLCLIAGVLKHGSEDQSSDSDEADVIKMVSQRSLGSGAKNRRSSALPTLDYGAAKKQMSAEAP